MDKEWSTLRKLIWLHMLLGGGAVNWTTVTGASPLSLVNALAKPIRSLVQYGKCVQDGTPTPSAPVDIVCNNGALQMVHRSGLPSGYKLLEYVGGSGTQYVITDLYLASTDVIECEYRNSSTTGYGAVYGIYKTGESSALYGNQTYYGYDVSNNKVDTRVTVDTEWHSSRHDFVNGTLTIDDTTVSFTPFEFENTNKNAVLSRYYNNSYGYNWKGYVRKFKVTRSGEVVCDLLPAKNSNDVAGLYDLISGDFYTATGGTLLEGDEVDDYELRVVGTPEVLTVSATGAATQTASVVDLLAVGDYADTQEVISGAVTRKVSVYIFDGSEDWTKASGADYFRLDGMFADAIPYSSDSPAVICTHFEGKTPKTSASGMADGDIKLGYTSTYNRLYLKYFAMTTVDDLKAFLAAQYAAGTPVIFLYPLAEETTEQVARQPLSTGAGDNVLTVTAEISDIQLTAEYAASA